MCVGPREGEHPRHTSNTPLTPTMFKMTQLQRRHLVTFAGHKLVVDGII